jgi:uncharacterized protein YbcV (DUF1398 family)
MFFFFFLEQQRQQQKQQQKRRHGQDAHATFCKNIFSAGIVSWGDRKENLCD